MKTAKLSQKNLQNELSNLKLNLDNLFKIGFYSNSEYKLYLDEIENMELYLMMKTN